MLNYILFFIGIIIILASFYVIRKESLYYSNTYDNSQNYQEIVNSISSIEEVIMQMNTTYYDIIKELEEKYLYLYEIYRLYNTEEPDIDFIKKNNQDESLHNEVNNIIINSDNNKDKSSSFTNDKILKLKEKGFSISQIAKELNKGIGEVQLYLNIRKK